MAGHKLILDGDYGIDDTLAALYLCHQPDVEILAVGTVHGNATADDAARNALVVFELGGRPEVPVAVGARRPLAQPVDISSMVHGEDGLGGHAPALPPGRKLADVAAAPGSAPSSPPVRSPTWPWPSCSTRRWPNWSPRS